MSNKYLNNKKIINLSPNYYKIIDAEFDKNDYITEKLINIYIDFLFGVDINNKNDIKKVIKLDNILVKYLDESHFRNEINKGLKTIKVRSTISDVINYIIDKIFEIFENYKEGYTRNIYISRWI